MFGKLPIVVFSHLRWDFVYQRPQQLLSRLALRRRVVYIEEPIVGHDEPSGWMLSRPAAGVLVARPRIAGPQARTTEGIAQVMGDLVHDLMTEERIEQSVAWVYTPMALPLIDAVAPALVVYDCMDELSLFLGAPPELLRREAVLLGRADLVFTGGRSLYEAKRCLSRHVSCFPSSVDATHFARARPELGLAVEPPGQAALSRPRLGFFGVIDERLELALLEELATSHPGWQIVMVGPTVKIDPKALPVFPNIHYVGQCPYEDLPTYLAGWDVCLLPFAQNDATRFISPTKTLEYMAAERPIVSTRVADVVSSYGDIVYLADTPATFVRACERALEASVDERESRAAAMRAVVAETSWDLTVSRMEQLIEESLAGSRARHT